MESFTDQTDDSIAKGPPKWRSTRFLLSYVACCGTGVLFALRASLSLAVVCMVNHTAIEMHHHPAGLTVVSDNDTNTTYTVLGYDDQPMSHLNAGHQSCLRHSANSTPQGGKEDGPFLWDKETQGLLLASFYIGFTIMQVPGSYVIHRYGARLVAGCSVLVMSVCHALCHLGALLSPWAVFGLRVVMGTQSAFASMALYNVWGRWAPRAEQVQLLGVTFAGETLGNMVAFPVSGLLCRHGFAGGWPSIFYVFGGVGVAWSAVWFFMSTNGPESHPRIDCQEREFIVNSRAAVLASRNKMGVPWKELMLSRCVWAIIIAFTVYNWGLYLFLSNLPIFYYEILGFDIQSNGFYSMLPFATLFVVLTGTGFVCNVLVKRRLLSLLTVRRLCVILGYVTPAVLLVVMCHLDCSHVAAIIVMLVTSTGFTGLAFAGGFFVNPYDIAPRFATSICTTASTFSSSVGILNPYVIAAVTKDQLREQWQIVFYVTSALYVAGAAVYCLLVRVDVQPWAVPTDKETVYSRALKEADSPEEKNGFISETSEMKL